MASTYKLAFVFVYGSVTIPVKMMMAYTNTIIMAVYAAFGVQRLYRTVGANGSS